MSLTVNVTWAPELLGVAPVNAPAILEDESLQSLMTGDVQEYRKRLLALEDHMREHITPIECPVRHHFAGGVYAREMTIPAGVLLTGKIHRYPQVNIVSKGRITVVTEEGMRTVEAPYTFVSPAGVKRLGYAHTDTVWTTLHGTHETDLEKIEAEFIAPTFEDLDADLIEFKERAWLGEQ